MLMNKEIIECMKHFNVVGLSIALISNGHLKLIKEFGEVEEGTDNKVTNRTIFNACSMSKFVTAMLVLKMVEEGILAEG